MKNQIFYAFFCFVILFSPVAFSAETYISIQNASVNAGESITIPVRIENIKNMGAIDIWLQYDKTVAMVENVSGGDVGELAAANIDNANGVTKMNWFRTQGMTGSFVFAYITITAIGERNYEGKITVIVNELVDADGIKIQYVKKDGLFTIMGGPNTPLSAPSPPTSPPLSSSTITQGTANHTESESSKQSTANLPQSAPDKPSLVQRSGSDKNGEQEKAEWNWSNAYYALIILALLLSVYLLKSHKN